jgi:hypothetical protein
VGHVSQPDHDAQKHRPTPTLRVPGRMMAGTPGRRFPSGYQTPPHADKPRGGGRGSRCAPSGCQTSADGDKPRRAVGNSAVTPVTKRTSHLSDTSDLTTR